MRHIFTAAALIGCMLLCGCEGGKDNASEAENIKTVTTTVIERTTEDNTSETDILPTTTKVAETAPLKQQETSTTAGNENIVIGGEKSADTTQRPSATKEQVLSTEATVTAATAAVPDSDAESGNILTDDGLNWSPLVPVN